MLTPEQCSAATEVCACSNFRRTSRAVTQMFDEALQPSGLRSTQLVILLTIMAQQGASIAHLARELVMDASSLNRNLRLMEQKRLVAIEQGHDSRRRVVTVTPAARRAVEKAVPLWEKAQSQLVAAFGDTKWEKLLDQLGTVIRHAR